MEPNVQESSNRYAELSQWCIAEAENYLRRGNNIQASEKGWGSVAQALKAIADDRGWNHGGHRRILDIIQQIADEQDDRQEMMRLFGAAQSLHTNFYEDWLDSNTIAGYMEDVRLLRLQLERIRGERPPAFAPETRDQRNRWRRLTRGVSP